MSLSLDIRDWNGTTTTISADSWDTVDDLKQKIENRTGTSADQIRLIYAGRALQATEELLTRPECPDTVSLISLGFESPVRVFIPRIVICEEGGKEPFRTKNGSYETVHIVSTRDTSWLTIDFDNTTTIADIKVQVSQYLTSVVEDLQASYPKAFISYRVFDYGFWMLKEINTEQFPLFQWKESDNNIFWSNPGGRRDQYLSTMQPTYMQHAKKLYQHDIHSGTIITMVVRLRGD